MVRLNGDRNALRGTHYPGSVWFLCFHLEHVFFGDLFCLYMFMSVFFSLVLFVYADDLGADVADVSSIW